METTDEKLEALEQTLTALLIQFKDSEKSLLHLFEAKWAEHLDQTDRILKSLEVIHTTRDMKDAGDNMRRLVQRISDLPPKFSVEHHHSYDIRSKAFVLGAVITFLTVALSIGLAFTFGIRNRELKGEAERFKVIRAFWPETAIEIDSAYLKNQKLLMKNADSRLQERQVLLDAELREKKKKLEYEKARDEREKLKAGQKRQ